MYVNVISTHHYKQLNSQLYYLRVQALCLLAETYNCTSVVPHATAITDLALAHQT